MDNNGLKMVPEKTEASLVTDRRFLRYPRIISGEHEVEWKTNIKYLGVQLDRTLSFSKHLQIVNAKVIQCRASLAQFMPNMKDGRHRLVKKWQMRWHAEQTGR